MTKAKKVRTDRAHLEMGKFKSNYPGVEKVAELEVTIADERARVGFHMYSGADETEQAEFAQLFAARKWIEMDEKEMPDDVDPALGTVAQALEQGAAEPVEDTDTVGRSEENEYTAESNGTQTEGEPAAQVPAAAKKGRGRPRKSVEERVAKAAKAVKEPKPVREKKEHAGKANFANWKDYYANSGLAKRAAAAEGKALFRPGSKREQAYHFLLKGATMEDVAVAFGWQKSAVASCFMQLEAVLGITYVKTKEAGKPTVYRIPGAADEEQAA